MRILLILPSSFPFPPGNGQEHHFAHLAHYLAERDEVSIACFTHGVAAPEITSAGSGPFADLISVPIPTYNLGSRLATVISPAPGGVRKLRSEAMKRAVLELVRRRNPQVVVGNDPAMTPYVRIASDCVKVLDYSCEFMLQAERFATLSHGPIKWLWLARQKKYAAFLRRMEPEYDLCLVNSQEDLDSLRRVWPEPKITLLTNGLDPSEYPFALENPQPNRLIYAGSVTYPPNLDAVRYLITDILPRIRAEIPQAELIVSGRLPPDGSEPRGQGIHYTGYVEDVRREIAMSCVSVVPLRLGAGGARYKVLESLALGVPMVATAIGFEGVKVEDEVNILHAEDPAEFAAKTVRLLRDAGLRDRIARAGRDLFEREYNWTVLGARLRDTLQKLCDTRTEKP